MGETPRKALNEKQKFLEELEFPSATMNATLVGRGSGEVYKPTATLPQRQTVRYELQRALLDLVALYPSSTVDSTVDEDAHVENIITLAKGVSAEVGKYLIGDGLTVGRAQKALNLYLKYLWCAGRKLMPPHCPFDGIVIGILDKLPELPPTLKTSHWSEKTGQWTETPIPWTAIADRDKYCELVKAARDRIKDESLAVWELRAWNTYQGRLRERYWASKSVYVTSE
jgi:hypothetical protein